MNFKQNKKRRRSEIWSQIASNLLGLEVEIKEGSSKNLEGIRGEIIEETTNLLRIKTKKESLWIQKKNQIFEIKLENNTKVLVEGKLLLGDPGTRIKKKIPNW
jgi:RNase P/RNase MRP subunit p29